MHYNPLKYVRSDTDILSFVNCYIMNTNGDGKAGDPFWENSERMLYTALIALLRDWFPPEDYNLPGLLTLLSMAEARENDENYKSPLDLLFLQIEEGKRYMPNDGGSQKAGPSGLSRAFVTGGDSGAWSWQPTNLKRNSDGKEPGKCGGLSPSEDFALMNYKNFKVAAGKTLKSIIISCNVRLAPIATAGIKELLSYDEMDIDHAGRPRREGGHLRHPLGHRQDPLVPVRHPHVADHRPALPQGPHRLRRASSRPGPLHLRRVREHRHHPAD